MSVLKRILRLFRKPAPPVESSFVDWNWRDIVDTALHSPRHRIIKAESTWPPSFTLQCLIAVYKERTKDGRIDILAKMIEDKEREINWSDYASSFQNLDRALA